MACLVKQRVGTSNSLAAHHRMSMTHCLTSSLCLCWMFVLVTMSNPATYRSLSSCPIFCQVNLCTFYIASFPDLPTIHFLITVYKRDKFYQAFHFPFDFLFAHGESLGTRLDVTNGIWFHSSYSSSCLMHLCVPELSALYLLCRTKAQLICYTCILYKV